MPFEQQTLRDLLEEKVVVSPLLRIALAATVIAGGLCFTAGGTVGFFFFLSTSQPVHPIAAAAFSFVIAAFGIAFLWLGVRLARTRANSHHLLSAVARRRCSFIVGGVALCLLAGAYEAGSLQFLAGAAALVVLSYWLFPLERQ